MIFFPASGHSQEQILALHAEDRMDTFPENTYFDGKSFGMTTQFGVRELIAREEVADAVESQADKPATALVEVILGDEVLFSVDVGDSSPIVPLQGLWSYDRNWVLEYVRITNIYDKAGNTVSSGVVGHLVKNGVLLNDQFSMDEIFGFQLLNGRPFYFFERGGKIGISYNEQETILGFEEIPHYGCCSAAMLNPQRAQNMVSFFAREGSVWYYVEIGVFDRKPASLVGTPIQAEIAGEPSSYLATPVAFSPASGICSGMDGEIITLNIYADIPDPRCAEVRPEQMLKVTNHTEVSVHVSIGIFEADIEPNGSYLFDTPVGEYLAPGVHWLQSSSCCSPELLLKPAAP